MNQRNAAQKRADVGLRFVYALEADQAFKFGISCNPHYRAPSLGHAFGPSRLIGYVPGTMEQERRLHASLLAYSMRGEWYAKNDVTRAAASLFEGCPDMCISGANSRRDENLRHLAAAKEMLATLMLPGEFTMSFLARIANELGVSFRFVKSIWYQESASIQAGDLDRIKRAVAPPVARISITESLTP